MAHSHTNPAAFRVNGITALDSAGLLSVKVDDGSTVSNALITSSQRFICNASFRNMVLQDDTEMVRKISLFLEFRKDCDVWSLISLEALI